MMLAMTLLVLIVANITYADFNQTDLETHNVGSWEFQTRQTQTYFDHTTEDIELGYSYLYADAVDGCLWSRKGLVIYGETEYDGPYGQNLTPELCDPDDETYSYELWDGNTYEHGSYGGVQVDTLLFTQPSGGGVGLGWSVGYLDDESVDEFCIGGC
jgi:hypothetical protein